ncbi:hypothetical protein F2P79_025215 [Pimephales promelas]|nr:hypothetical protein F2P79_025215 [Pimephales promelas]
METMETRKPHQLTNSKTSLSLLFSLLSEDHLIACCTPWSKTICTAMNSTRQDLDAIHTQYIRKVFWDPQRKGSRREMLAWTDVPVHHTVHRTCNE